MSGTTEKLAAAALAAAALAGASAVVASAKEVDVDGFVLRGGQSTGWDAAVDDFAGGAGDVDACRIRDAYSPARYGVTFEGRRLREGAFDYGAVFGNGEGQIGIYPEDNTASFNPRANTLTVGTTQIGGLVMSRTDKAAGQWLRTLVKMRDPDPGPETTDVTWDSALASAHAPLATSSGDQAFTTSDRWIVSGPGPTEWYDQQTIGFALFGKGAREKVTAVHDPPPGDPCVTVDFNVSVPANATRYMLFFTEQHSLAGTAKDQIKKYNRRALPEALLRGIPNSIRSKILNWDL